MTSPTLAGQMGSSPSATQEEFKDLGFGTEVAKGTRRRLLNRDGSFNVVRDGLNPLSSMSLYHWLLTISWPKFLAFITGSYIAINTLFAFAFLLLGTDALQSTTGSFAGQPIYRYRPGTWVTLQTGDMGNTYLVSRVCGPLILRSRSSIRPRSTGPKCTLQIPSLTSSRAMCSPDST